VNMVNLGRMPVSGETEKSVNGHWIIDYIDPEGPVDKAGIKAGDTIISCNAYSIKEWGARDHGQLAGDTLIFGILKNGQEIGIPVVITSRLSMAAGFYWPAFLIIILISTSSLFILWKKPRNKATKLFFLYIQQFAVMAVGSYFPGPEPELFIVTMAFHMAITMLGPTLIHFHMIFPEPVRILNRFRHLPALFYLIGLLLFIPNSINIIIQLYFGVNEGIFNFDFIAAGFLWLTITSAIALFIAILRFVTIRDTLIRNQLRIVLIGSLFGLITPVMMTTFSRYLANLWNIYPNLIQIAQGTGSLIMICCILIAIFRYRIWEIEIVLKKVLLYLLATAIIILSYLALLYLIDLFTLEETKTTRFIVLAVSVLVFLILRDRMQRLIERIFHRVTYDSATVIAEFEENLAGVYRIEELGSRILDGLNDIFQFNSLILSLRKERLVYHPAFILGLKPGEIDGEIEINREFENKLIKSKIFSPGEIQEKNPFFEELKSELIVPMVKDDQPFGFFVCGPKKSEKTYSMQDIRVLGLIAKRVIALFHTAELYQSDLDRQLMLERERARIAQDMHDDIGAGLTKIAMMSEAAGGYQGILRASPLGQARNPEPGTLEPWNPGTVERERMQKVATTTRDMINRLNVIVWALNPRYDNLESLVSYARRYFGEYLENFDITFRMEVPDEIPDMPVTPDFRRNAFYAWQEAVHNAIKHGHCSEIRFEVEFVGKILRITITDNGNGFDQARQGSGGNGLLNMKKRAEEMGGTFDIESRPGEGTRVLFTIDPGLIQDNR